MLPLLTIASRRGSSGPQVEWVEWVESVESVDRMAVRAREVEAASPARRVEAASPVRVEVVVVGATESADLEPSAVRAR
jgi:hypothetical protein